MSDKTNINDPLPSTPGWGEPVNEAFALVEWVDKHQYKLVHNRPVNMDVEIFFIVRYTWKEGVIHDPFGVYQTACEDDSIAYSFTQEDQLIKMITKVHTHYLTPTPEWVELSVGEQVDWNQTFKVEGFELINQQYAEVVMLNLIRKIDNAMKAAGLDVSIIDAVTYEAIRQGVIANATHR